MTRTIDISWAEVRHACKRPDAPRGTSIWGIPRGGIYLALVLEAENGCHLVDHYEHADIIVDDIRDSGATAERWQKAIDAAGYPVPPMWFAYDKREDFYAGAWLKMPWDRWTDERPGRDDAARMLERLGIELHSESMKDTPDRVFNSLQELTSGYSEDPAEILEKRFHVPCDEMVVMRRIPFFSLCEHHLLPFHGSATVGYINKDCVVGLSKIARLVHCFARRLQVQERLTQQVAETLYHELKAEGTGCVVRANHLCMEMRGVRTPGETVTSALFGCFRDPEVRSEFLALDQKGL